MVTEKCKQAYATLELKDDATEKEISKSFRKLSKEWHPDRNKQAGAKEFYKNILEAYSTLQKNCGENSLSTLEEMLKSQKPGFQFGGHREFDDSRIQHEDSKPQKADSWSSILFDFWNGVILGNSIEDNNEV